MTRQEAHDQACRSIISHIGQMPYGGLVANEVTQDELDMGAEFFIAAIADWLSSYRAVITRQSDDFTRMAAERNRLIDQRDAIRAFLGTTETAVD